MLDPLKLQFLLLIKRVREWLYSEPDPRLVRWRNFVTCLFVVVLCAYALTSSKMFGISETSLGPRDLSLAGTWKYRIADDLSFSDPNLNDSNWCLISVPDAGNPAVAENGDHPSEDCPKPRYPVEELRHRAYWYRKSFVIRNMSWTRPALFLGAIKDRGWIYLDGQLVGSSFLALTPNIIIVEPDRLKVGPHELAIRVETEGSLNPGIYHAYARLVSIGEQSDLENEIDRLKRDQEEQAITAVVQFVTLALLFFFTIRTGSENENFFWLALYFGLASLYGSSGLIGGPFQNLIEGLSLIIMSVSITGYGHYIFMSKGPGKNAINRLLIGAALVASMVKIFRPGDLIERMAIELSVAYAILLVAFHVLRSIFFRKSASDSAQPSYSKTDMATVIVLISLHGIHFYSGVLMGNHAHFIHLPFLTALLTILVSAISAEDYISKTLLLSFYSRFIRPGLRQLLWDFRGYPEAQHAWHRGKKIPIMKIDIVGYTITTYSMPWGIKRFHKDIWFGHLDKIMTGLNFLDMPQGDGSIYCIREDLQGGSCSKSIETARYILENVIEKFDEEFKVRAMAEISSSIRLQVVWQKFLSRYKGFSGHDFWDRRTKVRFVFHYGWIDEGLWGLKSQSHYDILADLLIDIARLEKHADADEFLVTRAFVEQWKIENPQQFAEFDLQWRTENLRGIGPFEYAIAIPQPRKMVA